MRTSRAAQVRLVRPVVKLAALGLALRLALLARLLPVEDAAADDARVRAVPDCFVFIVIVLFLRG